MYYMLNWKIPNSNVLSSIKDTFIWIVFLLLSFTYFHVASGQVIFGSCNTDQDKCRWRTSLNRSKLVPYRELCMFSNDLPTSYNLLDIFIHQIHSTKNANHLTFNVALQTPTQTSTNTEINIYLDWNPLYSSPQISHIYFLLIIYCESNKCNSCQDI